MCGVNAATSALSSVNDNFNKRSETEQTFDTTIGAIAAGASAVAVTSPNAVSKASAAVVAVGCGTILLGKEAIKTAHNLDNYVKEQITKDVKSDSDKKIILQVHEMGKIPH
jgi:uncharacterized membrane-anchored protein